MLERCYLPAKTYFGRKLVRDTGTSMPQRRVSTVSDHSPGFLRDSLDNLVLAGLVSLAQRLVQRVKIHEW